MANIAIVETQCSECGRTFKGWGFTHEQACRNIDGPILRHMKTDHGWVNARLVRIQS